MLMTKNVPSVATAARRVMTALIKSAPGEGHVDLAEVPEPECPPDGVKIRVHFAGICGTDLHVYHDRFRNYPPVILGHEFSGVVEETGPEVRSVAAGCRVTVLPSSAVVCGDCEYCRQGYYMFCPIRRGMGHGVDGCFTKYVVVREDQVYPLPGSVPLETGALAEPLASAVQAIEELTSFHPGDVVLLSGPGPIGLLCLLLLLSHKCRVIVAGTAGDTLRLALAKELGAIAAVDVSREDLSAVVQRETGGRGVDAAVECAGAAESVAACLRNVSNLGRYVQAGIVGREFPLPFDLILYKQLAVYGSVGHSLRTWDRVMRILAQGALPLEKLISHKMPLSRWREAFDLCENRQGVKVLLTYDGT
jgi:L-iditol 2-dehydrogenase